MSSREDKDRNTSHTAAGAEDFDQKIRRLDRLANLGLISASVAHEIKNGLVAINTFVELLLEKGQDKELSETVHRELRRIDGLVSQMMRFASQHRGGTAAEKIADVRIHELFEHTLRLLHYQLDIKQIKVVRKLDAAPGVVRGDEAQLQQVLMNLLLNAIEATGNGGTLTLSTSLAHQPGQQHPHLQVEVSDTGAGISPENLNRLFEPFFSTKKNGTGLGLTICDRIIREHGGSISARSVFGQGTTLRILLPAAG